MRTGVIRSIRNDNGVISRPPLPYVPDPRGLGCALFDKMVEHRKHVAQIDGITNEEEIYETLHRRCIRAAIAMRARGVTPDDIITISSYHHLDSCVPLLAALFLGAKPASLDPALCLSDATYLIDQVRPKITFVGPESVRLVEIAVRESGIETEIVVFGKSEVHTQFSEFLEPSPLERNFQPVYARNINDTAVIFFTAGTTGRPKGICMSHKSQLAQAYNITTTKPGIASRTTKPGTASSKTRKPSSIVFTSLYWIQAVSILIISVLFRRSRIIFPKFEPKSFWHLVGGTKADVIFLAPNQVQSICHNGRPLGIDISNLKQVLIAGGHLSKMQVQELGNILPGVDIVNMYAIAEAGGYVMSFKPHTSSEDARLLRAKPHSCGRPSPGFSCKVVDNETGEILGPFQAGELRIKTEFQMNSYFNQDSSNCWDADGWLKTGDVAYYDEDCCFFIVDRIKEMLRFRSWDVAPSKLEGVLHSHPAVETAVVVGLPDPEDGDHAVGVVVLRSCAVGTVTAVDIEHFVDQRVSYKHKLRGGVRIVHYIPLTPMGKARRRDMRELVLRNEI